MSVETQDRSEAEPTEARRPWRGLTRRDWAWLLVVAGLTTTNALATYLTLRSLPTAPTAGLWISAGLLAAFMAVSGAVAAYIIMRRRQLELADTASEVIEMYRELRAIYYEMRPLVEDAYQAGQSDGQQGYDQLLEVLDETQERVDELERELAARTARVPAGPSLRELTKQVAALQSAVAEVQQRSDLVTGGADELERRIAAVRAEADSLGQQIDAQQARRLPLDAIDEQILALLTADATLTDDEISRHPKVSLHRTQVTRRRNRLAAGGYSAAQKHQGRRPSTR